MDTKRCEAKPIRILTTRMEWENELWLQHVQLLPCKSPSLQVVLEGEDRRRARSLWKNLLLAIQLLRFRRHYDVIVTGGERIGHFFALLQTILMFGKVPHVMIECLWTMPRQPVRRWLKKLQLLIEAQSINCCVVCSSLQAQAYPMAFGLPPEKFRFVPYHTYPDVCNFSTSTGDYVFAGGDTDRDYRTFIEAVRDLNVKVTIATLVPERLGHLGIPTHVRIVSVSHDEFRQLMAGARIVVVPLKGGVLHSRGGHTTYLNAMAMGKPVVVVDDVGVFDYIEDGRTGFIVKPGDVASLKETLLYLLDNPALAAQVGKHAREAAQGLSMDTWIRNLLSIIETRGMGNLDGRSTVGTKAS